MLRYIKSYLPILVTVVVMIFAVHFLIGMICRASPDPKVGDRFDAYLKPGILVLFAPFLFLSKLFQNGWGLGGILGVFIYFGAMLAYSVLWTLALFGIYKVFRKVVTWKHQEKSNIHHPTEFSSGGQ